MRLIKITKTIESPASSSCRSDSGLDERRASVYTLELPSRLRRRRSTVFSTTSTNLLGGRRRSSIVSTLTRRRSSANLNEARNSIDTNATTAATDQVDEDAEDEDDEEEDDRNCNGEVANSKNFDDHVREAFVVLMSDSFEVISLPADMMQVQLIIHKKSKINKQKNEQNNEIRQI